MNCPRPHRWLALAACVLAGCASLPINPTASEPIDRSRLPAPDVALAIPDLGPCDDGPDRTLHLDSRAPVTVLVHGCFSSAGRFRALAQVHAFQGRQALCFSYDDRATLSDSAARLQTALRALAAQTTNREFRLLGHSQGGLVARHALTATEALPADARLQLATISSPFAGIAAADHCGSKLLRRASLGVVNAICNLATGAKWREITATSDFIRSPGALAPQVTAYLKLETDERDSCRRRRDDGGCDEDDFVFSLDEQRQPAVDASEPIAVREVRAGHVEIVGDHRNVPDKLIGILQQHDFLGPTEPARSTAFNALLERLYLGDG